MEANPQRDVKDLKAIFEKKLVTNVANKKEDPRSSNISPLDNKVSNLKAMFEKN